MKYPSAFAIVLFLTFSTAGQTASTKLSELDWLAGCWEMNAPDKKLLITEQWTKPAGGMMIGAGRTVKKAGRRLITSFCELLKKGIEFFT